MLTQDDFQIVTDSIVPHWRWQNEKIQICFEPCFNGFDIAVYDRLGLLEPKQCLNAEGYGDVSDIELAGYGLIAGRQQADWDRGLKIANKYYEKWGK